MTALLERLAGGDRRSIGRSNEVAALVLRRRALRRYLRDPSRIVRTFALQALADLSAQDPALRPSVARLARRALRAGPPSMRSRARKLLKRLGLQ